MKPAAIATLAAICLGSTPGCSRAEQPAERNAEAAATSAPAVAAEPRPKSRSTPRPAGDRAGSRVLGEKDFTLRGEPACEIRFAYAGREAENLFWEEPCAAVTAKMMTRQELEALGKWGRLDDFAKKFVQALPGGRVLYVEGGFSASVYPVGTTGSTYEVPVAD
ncbi:hypothetical protein [Sphingomonas lenta]|uniref:Uncharacterized protein n=1 Tax=Sphingomonas lenta TaxID=1141887 RepID=A0A2A2SE59_9SPHN|nr:hypothetical protein [Sphingomonas lenta]PAX07470.1 hypothetical protein CKY28_07325 [Sphingomonas lenta]